MLAVGADAGEGVHRFLGMRPVEAFLHELGIAEDGGERGPELMAHVGDELRLVLARDLQLAALLGDLLEQTRVLQRDSRLVGEGLHKADDGLGELARVAARRTSVPSGPSACEQRDNQRCAKSRFKHSVAQGIARDAG